MRPDVYFFNPTCEPAIANGSPYYTAPARLRQFEENLGYLPIWLAGEKDHVLIQGEKSPSFEERMADLGFRLPTTFRCGEALADPNWLVLQKGFLRPWGWSPAVHQLFRPAIESFSKTFAQSPVAFWQSDHKKLFSRLTGNEMLRKLLASHPVSWLTAPVNIPQTADHLEHIYRMIGAHSTSVVKTPWSSSGRGLLCFPNPDSRKKNDEVLRGMLQQQGFVSVEPWLNKEADISFQFILQKGNVSYLGMTFFETDPKGRYVRNFITEDANLSPLVVDFLKSTKNQVVEWLLEQLSQSEYRRLYEGWIGIDAMIYRSEGGDLKFHPVVEVNGRFTMGALALKLRHYLASGSSGYLSVYYSKHSNFAMFAEAQSQAAPLVMAGNKIVKGFLPLTPPTKAHAFGAYLLAVTEE